MTSESTLKSAVAICGSRALSIGLGGTHFSQQWMIRTLLSVFYSPMQPYDLVINGGCDGVDARATDIGRRFGCRCREFRLDGWVYAIDASSLVQSSRWHASGGRIHPLERNRIMIHQAAALVPLGWTVSVVGLIAPWSLTHGTDHTLTQADQASLPNTRIVCPVEYHGEETVQ